MSSNLFHASFERIRRTVREMSYASRRIVEVQAPWIR